MSDRGQQTEQRTCRFPGCEQPVARADADTGRPPEYCDDAGHNRGAAWRARRRLSAEPSSRSAEDEKRPVDAARQRAGEIRGQVAGMVEHLGAQLNALVEELRTVADPDAAEAQIESVTTEAAEQVAAASARASRAEQGRRQAEAERVEADAAAMDASELAEQLQATLTTTQQEASELADALDEVATELAAAQLAAASQNAQAQSDLAQLREQLAAAQTRLAETETNRDEALQRAEIASRALAEADERARGAVARSDEEAARALRAESDLMKVREQLDQAYTDREELRENAGSLRATLATVTAERDAARTETERERTHGEQRVSDMRAMQELQLTSLRNDLTEARTVAREQRSRADGLGEDPGAR